MGFYSSPDVIVSNLASILKSDSVSPITAKKKRAFHRLLSGFTRARYRGDRLRFMTLTSIVGASPERMRRYFQVLRKRVEHRFHFKIEYWSIRTNEGNGVLHFVFKGRYIPQAWLSDAWASITGASIVDIRALKNHPRKLANYLVSNYLCKQTFERISWSWGWVFRGFCGVWKGRFASWYKVDRPACLLAWDKLVCTASSPARPFHYGSLGVVGG